MPEVQSSFEKVIAEHRELRQMVQGMCEFLQQERPEVGTEGAHQWAATLSERLVKLHDKLFLHFREEDESGMFQELAEKFPRASTALENLDREHKEMLSELREIVSSTMSYSEEDSSAGPGLRQRTCGLLDKLIHHEEQETNLIEKLYYDDIGVGD
jgi:iron-sulfur cluster repair protein YtfE (RIC family)